MLSVRLTLVPMSVQPGDFLAVLRLPEPYYLDEKYINVHPIETRGQGFDGRLRGNHFWTRLPIRACTSPGQNWEEGAWSMEQRRVSRVIGLRGTYQLFISSTERLCEFSLCSLLRDLLIVCQREATREERSGMSTEQRRNCV
jgi:hypothetical protein